MSVEEDTELRNLVAQTLENKGILPKIRAELRANVFLALEENVSTRETLLKNEELSSFIQIPLGILILNLVREFLEFFGLDFTLSVFDPETKYGKDYNSISREKMMKELNITESRKKGPLLYQLISKIVHDFQEETKNNVKNDKSVVALNLNHCDTTLNGEDDIISPSSNFNTTYVKSKLDGNSTPVSGENSNGDNENNDSITEKCISNNQRTPENSYKESETKATDQLQKAADLSLGASDELNSFKPIPDNTSEFDLLTFTPVKEVKTKERIPREETAKNITVKEKISNTSVLGDLPPLNAKTEAKRNKMNEIKAIINQGLNLDNYDDEDDDFHSSVSTRSSKNGTNGGEDSDKYAVENSDKSQNVDNTSDKSDKTDVIEENLEEDLSDLINHDFTENQLTMDETVSKLSDLADHMESL